MKKIILLALFILFTLHLHCQVDSGGYFKGENFLVGRIISDTTTFDSTQSWADFPSILESVNKIEIRFITYPSFRHGNCFIMTYNDSWALTYYYYDKGSDTITSIKYGVETNIDSIFSSLVHNNIFSLRAHNDLNLDNENLYYYPKIDMFLIRDVMVLDGTSYAIEFKIKDRYRRYKYHNPKIYSKKFSLVYELRCMANIVEIFDKLKKPPD